MVEHILEKYPVGSVDQEEDSTQSIANWADLNKVIDTFPLK